MALPPSRIESLDFTPAEFRELLRAASDIVVRLYEGLDTVRVTPDKGRKEIASLFDEPLPERPESPQAVLAQIEERIFANSTLSLTPRFFGYINGGGNELAVVADLLAAALNQIPAKWHFSPAATEVERRLMHWIAEFVGYSPASAGCLLSGGSAAHVVGLALARNEKLGREISSKGMYGAPRATVYVSCERNVSVDRAMSLLGLGTEQLRIVPVRSDFTIDVAALEAQVADDRQHGLVPICVIGNAGSTATGAVDRLDELAHVCEKESLWFHVDGAYGVPAASTRIAGDLFRGLDRADSIVVNPHKWLYVPVEAACILVREPVALRSVFRMDADYLHEETDQNRDGALDFKDYNPQLSRSFKALKTWATFKVYGAERLRAAIESNIRIMRYLGDLIDESSDFVRVAPVPLSTVCFQYRTTDGAVHGDQTYLNWLNAQLLPALERDGRVFLSGTKIEGQSVLRACSVNHRLAPADVEIMLSVIRDVARPLLAMAPAST